MYWRDEKVDVTRTQQTVANVLPKRGMFNTWKTFETYLCRLHLISSKQVGPLKCKSCAWLRANQCTAKIYIIRRGKEESFGEVATGDWVRVIWETTPTQSGQRFQETFSLEKLRNFKRAYVQSSVGWAVENRGSWHVFSISTSRLDFTCLWLLWPCALWKKI